MKIQEQSYPEPTQFQISKQLRFMNGKDTLRRLKFNDHRIFYDQINTVAAIESDGFVDNRERKLPRKGEAMGLQFETEALFVG